MKYDSNGTKKECTVWVHPSETSAYPLNPLLSVDDIIIFPSQLKSFCSILQAPEYRHSLFPR